MKLKNENVSILFKWHYLRSEDKSEYIDTLHFARTAIELAFLAIVYGYEYEHFRLKFVKPNETKQWKHFDPIPVALPSFWG